MRLSQKYADHSAELGGITNYLTGTGGGLSDDATRLGITVEELDSINGLHALFFGAYSEYTSPKTHNAITVHAMKVADDNAYAVILPFRQRLKNGLVDLTPDDYANLGIHQDKTTRTPAETPIDVPMPLLVDSRPLNLEFEATEQSTEGVNRVALPKDCRVAREIAVLAADATPTDADFHTIDTIGRSRFTIVFSAPEVGMNAYLRLAYENSAGRGPFSQPVKAIII